MKYPGKLLIISSLAVASLILSACGSLLNAAEQAVQNGKYGPAYSTQEHQARTFDALWKNLTDNYIYYDSAKVDWKALHDKYQAKLASGLTDAQFSDLMHQLVNELPNGALAYQSRSERIDADTADLSTFEGIGAFVSFQKESAPHAVILQVMAGSPAEKAGLKSHDSILAIDGKSVQADEGQAVVNRIRGPAGSTVTLEVKTPGQDQRSIQVTRGKLSNSGQQINVDLIKGTQDAYVLFPPVGYQTISQDFVSQLQALADKQELKGLILDLRISGSGGGFPLQDLLTLFYNGSIGEFYNRAKQVQPLTVTGQDQNGSQKIPLVILVGPQTSGAPEILAAALQAGKRAKVIGGITAGQVENADAFLLPDGSRVYIATSSFKMSDGKDLGATGFQPDVTIDTAWDQIQPNTDPVLDQALKILDGQK